MTYRLISLILICNIAISCTVQQNTQKEPPNRPKEVTIVTFGVYKMDRLILDPIVDSFNRKNIDVQVKISEIDDIAPLNSDGNPDDDLARVVQAVDTAALFHFPLDTAITRGLIHDLTPFIEADATFNQADFFPAALQPRAPTGGVYLLPRAVGRPLLRYNAELFQQNQLKAPKANWTWNDLLATAMEVTDRSSIDRPVYGFFDDSRGLNILKQIIATRNIDIRHSRLDNPAIAAALEQTLSYITDGTVYIAPQRPDGGFDGNAANALILTQQIAMWPSYALSLETAPPFTMGTIPLPRSTESFELTYGFVLSSAATDSAAAWRWLAFLSHQTTIHPLTPGRVPARQSLADQGRFWQLVDAATGAAIKTALSQPATPPTDTGKLDALLQQALDASLYEKKSVISALNTAELNRTQVSTLEPTTTVLPHSIPATIPKITEHATKIRFDASILNKTELQPIVDAFNASQSEVAVELSGVFQAGVNIDAAQLARKSDCFAWFVPVDNEASFFHDIQPLFDADATISPGEYVDKMLAPLQQHGKLLGLPYEAQIPLLYYNPALFTAAGLPLPSTDWTIRDLRLAALQLQTSAVGNGEQTYGFAVIGSDTELLDLWLDAFNTRLSRATGELPAVNFLDPSVITALQAYLEIMRVSPHTRLRGYLSVPAMNDIEPLVHSGRVALWTYAAGRLSGTANPGATAEMSPFPTKVASSPLVKVNNALYISATSQYPDACWMWIKFLSSESHGFQGGFPARRSLAHSAAFRAGVPAHLGNVYAAYLATFDSTATTANASIQTYHASILDHYWFYRAVDRALQGKDLERELQVAQTLTEQYLACARSGGERAACAKQVDPEYQGWARP